MSPPAATLLYLSRADVEACGLGPGETIAAIERAFAGYAEGKARIGHKGRVPVAAGHFFQSMPALLENPPLAGMKWFGITPDNPGRGLPNVCGLILLSDIETALPVAVLEGDRITGARTAAMSAAAAKRLALPEAKSAAFIGCGVQARSHAVFLHHVLPGLRRAVLFGRGAGSRDTFAAELRRTGWEVKVADTPEAALDGAEIVVSTVPEYPGFKPFLDPAWLKPGVFVAAVDLGRSWLPAPPGTFDLIATDDAEQSRGLVAEGRLNTPGEFGADLTALVSGKCEGRRSADERIIFVFAGHALADVAAAAAVYQAALARNLGTPLPR
jgi:ornithine cyclodeaminase/alanine dehydrogenase-like protein (mu-crystallin family)